VRAPSVNFFNVENIQDWGMDGEVKRYKEDRET
jgi:hypothetical protein